VNKELKRRSHVIGIFPNEASLIRLIGSVLIEENIRSLSSRRIFKKESLEKMNKEEVPSKLIQIAREQEALLAA
jgi:putative transposase